MFLNREDAKTVIGMAEQIAEHGWLDECEQSVVFRLADAYSMQINRSFFGGQDEGTSS